MRSFYSSKMGYFPSLISQHQIRRFLHMTTTVRNENQKKKHLSLTENDHRRIDQFASFVEDCDSILFITGAGISVASGLPTYRGVGGLYGGDDDDGQFALSNDGVSSIEEALSANCFAWAPHITWKYIHQLGSACRHAEPNGAHVAITKIQRHYYDNNQNNNRFPNHNINVDEVEKYQNDDSSSISAAQQAAEMIERRIMKKDQEKKKNGTGKVFKNNKKKNITVLTQNVDGLHQRAGNHDVIEMHGNAFQFYCVQCGAPPSDETLLQKLMQYNMDVSDLPPRCPHCSDGSSSSSKKKSNGTRGMGNENDDGGNRFILQRDILLRKLGFPSAKSIATTKGIIRPNVVLFDEQLPEEALRRRAEVTNALRIYSRRKGRGTGKQQGSDEEDDEEEGEKSLVVSIGTSAMFGYICEPFYCAKSRGHYTVDINPDGESALGDVADLRFRCGAEETMNALVERLQI